MITLLMVTSDQASVSDGLREMPKMASSQGRLFRPTMWMKRLHGIESTPAGSENLNSKSSLLRQERGLVGSLTSFITARKCDPCLVSQRLTPARGKAEVGSRPVEPTRITP